MEKKKYQFYRDKFNLDDEEGDEIHASDINDLKQILALEEIADINRQAQGETIYKKESNQLLEFSDDELMIGIDQIKKGGKDSRAPAKTLGDPKNYMDMIESPNGDLTVKLYLPPYELDKLKAGYKKMVTIRLDKDTRDQLREIFDSHKDIVAFTDGASIGNPGESGAGVVFYAK